MYLLLDDHNVILAMSEMCDKVPKLGWKISKNSIYRSLTATRVEVDDVPAGVVPQKYKYQDGAFSLVNEVEESVDITKQIEEDIKSLQGDVRGIKKTVYTNPNDMPMEDFRAYLKEYNNSLLDKFLKEHPLPWTNGKCYGATNDDQTLMLKNYNGWKMLKEAGADVKLEWNAANEGCSELSEAEYLQLMGAIYMYAKKMLKLCQWYKLKIINAVTRVELNELKFEYSIELADEVIEKLGKEG